MYQYLFELMDRVINHGYEGECDQSSISMPICSMYGIFTNICPKNHPNVGKYTIHGAYGMFHKEIN